MGNYQIIETTLVFIIVYMIPLMIFIKLSRRKNISILVLVIISILYIVLSILTENLFPFIFTVLNILLIKNYKIKEEDTVTYSRVDDNDVNSHDYHKDYEKYKFSIKTFNFYDGLKYSLLSYFLFIIIIVLFQYIFSKLNIDLKQQEIVEETMSGTWTTFLIAIPTIVIFAPVVEEFIFRWFLFEKIFKARIGTFSSAIITSIMFSFVHFNTKAFPVLLALSLVNCYLIHKKGYWYAVFNHSVFNSVTIISMIIQRLSS
jgi:membrane protease YdiL (CAAX protease family)